MHLTAIAITRWSASMDKSDAIGDFLTDLTFFIAVFGFCLVVLAYLGAL